MPPSKRPKERRNPGGGRRAADRLQAPPAWARILLLAVTLGVAAYVLLFAREIARPAREADSLRQAAIQSDADLLAARFQIRLGTARAGLAVRPPARGNGRTAPHLSAMTGRTPDSPSPYR